MSQADNGSARIRRAYYKNGALKSDTLRTAKYARPCAAMPGDDQFTSHIYGLNFSYDLDGRRKTLTHPAQFCAPENCVESYAYDANIAALDTVVDIKGNTHSFVYDLAGRLSQRRSPGNVVDQFTYDSESNLTAHTVGLDGGYQYLSDNASFDRRGKMVSAHTQSPQGTADILFSYSGLGAVTGSEQQGTIGGFNTEEFIVDALGNRAERRQGTEAYEPEDPQRHRTLTYNQLNQLTQVDGPPTVPPYNFLYTESYQYDGAGNTTLFHRNTNGSGGGGLESFNDTKQLKLFAIAGAKRGVGPRAEPDFSSPAEIVTEPYHHDSHMSYYGGDGKLRIFNRHIGVSGQSADSTYGQRGTFDEYRYDALGRRVLARTRRIGVGCHGTLDCESRAIRTVWDGDRVLYEIKAAAGEVSDTVPVSGIESDFEYVSYTHAAGVSGIDEPIGIHKGSETVISHTGWRGMLAMGTYPSGGQSDCAVVYPCTRIDWPAAKVTTDGAGYGRAEPSTWYGSLASTGTEGSGLQYMRNRYYDPKRGQFTQADPIGLAGGLNLYGFAAGDPVSYRDPFGLCPPCEGDDLNPRKLDQEVRMAEYGAAHPRVALAAASLLLGVTEGTQASGIISRGFGILRNSPAALQRWRDARASGYGDLTVGEVNQIQAVVDRAGRPLDVVGSAARGARGPTSDIDYTTAASSIDNFRGLEGGLPGRSAHHSSILRGVGNSNEGPVIRFEPRTLKH